MIRQSSPLFNNAPRFNPEAKNDRNNSRCVLILGSVAWDLLPVALDGRERFDLEDHLESIRNLIDLAKQAYGHKRVDIYWRSPTALHIHETARKSDWHHFTSVFYASSSRALRLYSAQKRLMQELGIPFLDIYWATYLSADWLIPGDGRHCLKQLNRRMLGWFYKTGSDQGPPADMERLPFYR